jgi:hypothetical protein
MLKEQFGKKIKRDSHSDNGGEYISNELKDVFLTSVLIHELTTTVLSGIKRYCRVLYSNN